MKPLKNVPLTSEEEHEICRKCGGFCCKYYFSNTGDYVDGIELHTFRKRKVFRYGKSVAVVLEDRCPYTDDEKQTCTRYTDPKLPALCRKFPDKYRPFWNLNCKLMRVRYARRLIPKEVVAFSKLRQNCKPKETFMKFFK